MNSQTKFLAKFMKVALVVLIIITLVLMLTLPLFVNYYSKTFYRPKLIYSQIILYLTYYPVAVCALIIESRLRKMFISVCNNNSFVIDNVKHLNTMGYTMIVVTVIFLLKSILLPTLSSIAFTIGSALLAIFCFVLGGVFFEAVNYKQDNDLTI